MRAHRRAASSPNVLIAATAHVARVQPTVSSASTATPMPPMNIIRFSP